MAAVEGATTTSGSGSAASNSSRVGSHNSGPTSARQPANQDGAPPARATWRSGAPTAAPGRPVRSPPVRARCAFQRRRRALSSRAAPGRAVGRAHRSRRAGPCRSAVDRGTGRRAGEFEPRDTGELRAPMHGQVMTSPTTASNLPDSSGSTRWPSAPRGAQQRRRRRHRRRQQPPVPGAPRTPPNPDRRRPPLPREDGLPCDWRRRVGFTEGRTPERRGRLHRHYEGARTGRSCGINLRLLLLQRRRVVESWAAHAGPDPLRAGGPTELGARAPPPRPSGPKRSCGAGSAEPSALA